LKKLGIILNNNPNAFIQKAVQTLQISKTTLHRIFRYFL